MESKTEQGVFVLVTGEQALTDGGTDLYWMARLISPPFKQRAGRMGYDFQAQPPVPVVTHLANSAPTAE